MGGRPPRSNEDIAKSAAGYRTRADFQRGDAGGYTLSEKAQNHRRNLRSHGIRWCHLDEGTLLEEARKHSRRWELGKAIPLATIASTHGVARRGICPHGDIQEPRVLERGLLYRGQKSTRTRLSSLRDHRVTMALHYGMAGKTKSFAYLTYARQYYDEPKVTAIAAHHRTARSFKTAHQPAYTGLQERPARQALRAHGEARQRLPTQRLRNQKRGHQRNLHRHQLRRSASVQRSRRNGYTPSARGDQSWCGTADRFATSFRRRRRAAWRRD